MPQFEVDVAGENLGAAMATLNSTGIPTISYGGDPAGPFAAPQQRPRSLRNWIFGILAVIVVLFFFQRLISPGESEREPTYDEFIEQVEQRPATIAEVTLNTGDAELEVEETDGDEYSMGYPPSSESSLVNILRRRGIATVVEAQTGGTFLDWLFYLLPYGLLFGLFWFLFRRMRDREGPQTSWKPHGLKAVVAAESAEDAEAIVRTRLQPAGDFRVGPARQR